MKKMKNLLKKFLVVAVVLGTYTGYANTTLETESPVTIVRKGNLISVSDAFGEIIYSGEINYNGNLMSLFNFTQLKDGEYTIEIDKDFEIEVKTITVKKGVVSSLTESNTKIFKPVFRTKDSKLIISKLGFKANEMTVKLYYGNTLIHTEKVKGEGILDRVYQLDKAVKGEYSAVITTNNRVFVENFSI